MNKMSPRVLAAVGVVVLFFPEMAQAQFAADQRYVGAHIGLSGVGSAVNVGLDGEWAYDDNIGIGAWLDTWSFGQSFTVLGSTTSWNIRYVSVAGTGAYHFPVEGNPKVDPFVGAALGYFIVSSSVQGTTGGTFTGSASRAFLGAFGGVRYALNEQVNGVARIGVGASYLSLGIDLKL